MNNNQDLLFEVVAICHNTMESELLPATLRERDIPHRAVRGPQGEMILLVPKDWKAEAEEALQQASAIFFNETKSPNASATEPTSYTAPENNEDDEEDDRGFFRHTELFSRSRGLVSPEKTRVRSMWLAWCSAAVPGLGLGSFYAGNTQLGIMLMLLSVAGLAYFLYQGSIWGLVVVAISWLIDLAWAPLQIRQQNTQARMLAKEAAEAEKEFLKTVSKS
jgi:hypothetical protein